jgi:hypothetical protein
MVRSSCATSYSFGNTVMMVVGQLEICRLHRVSGIKTWVVEENSSQTCLVRKQLSVSEKQTKKCISACYR